MNTAPLGRIKRPQVQHAVDDEHLKVNSRKKVQKLAQQRDLEENIDIEF